MFKRVFFLVKKKKKRKILLKNSQSPGDILMLTAAVRDLKLAHPEIEIGVSVSCQEIWENNPYITKLNQKDKDVEVFKAEYPLVHDSNDGQYHFIHGFRKHLEELLNLRIPATKFRGDIHISDVEKSWISQVEEIGVKDQFWIMMAGGKKDFTAKWWSSDYYQRVVDHFKGKMGDFIRELYEKYVIKGRLTVYEGKLWAEGQEFINEIKRVLGQVMR